MCLWNERASEALKWESKFCEIFVNDFFNKSDGIQIFYCSVVVHNIKIDWVRYACDGHPRDK